MPTINTAQRSVDEVRSAIRLLDLNSVRAKLLSPDSGLRWTATKARQVEIRYRQFLLRTFAERNIEHAPTSEVDAFWHQHILDTQKYAHDCEQVFGYFLHHKPEPGSRSRKCKNCSSPIRYPEPQPKCMAQPDPDPIED